MGSHRARPRSDGKQSEESVTDLLARLAAEAQPVRERPTPRFALDRYATGPVPARPPRSTTQNLVLAGSGATHCAGPTRRARRGGAHAATTGLPAGRAAQFPIDPDEADAPAGLAAGEPAADTPRAGRPPRTGARIPLYATVSATVLTAATAAVAASTGPFAITHPNATPNLPAPSAAAAGRAALSLALPTANPTPVTPQTLGGPAALLAPDGAVAQGSDIVAGAEAAAKAIGAQQAQQAPGAATDPAIGPTIGPVLDPALGAALGAIPAHLAPPHGTADPAPTMYKPTPKPVVAHAPKTTVAPAAAAGSGLGSRALALAKGKLGDPYVWGSAGPNAFDCSGLVVWAFKQLGKGLPHSSATLSTMGTLVSKTALQPGDLVFFYSPVSHVGIYAGNGMVLNATESGQPVQYTKLANMPFHSARRIAI
jgi:peptidoglycan DL-endopeptidase CwlO